MIQPKQAQYGPLHAWLRTVLSTQQGTASLGDTLCVLHCHQCTQPKQAQYGPLHAWLNTVLCTQQQPAWVTH